MFALFLKEQNAPKYVILSEVFGAKNPDNLVIPGTLDASGDLSMTKFS